MKRRLFKGLLCILIWIRSNNGIVEGLIVGTILPIIYCIMVLYTGKAQGADKAHIYWQLIIFVPIFVLFIACLWLSRGIDASKSGLYKLRDTMDRISFHVRFLEHTSEDLTNSKAPSHLSLLNFSLSDSDSNRKALDRYRTNSRNYFQVAYNTAPYLQRLNFIRQAGTLNFHQHIDAAHNRLSHTFGTLEAALLMLESIHDKDGNVPDKGTISDLDREAVAIAAIIHDLFIGPFSHSLEPLRSLLLQETKKRIKKKGGQQEKVGFISGILKKLRSLLPHVSSETKEKTKPKNENGSNIKTRSGTTSSTRPRMDDYILSKATKRLMFDWLCSEKESYTVRNIIKKLSSTHQEDYHKKILARLALIFVFENNDFFHSNESFKNQEGTKNGDNSSKIQERYFALSQDQKQISEKYFLREIVDSAGIDADRVDYTLRDSIHMGFNNGIQPQNVLGLLSKCRLIEETDQIHENLLWRTDKEGKNIFKNGIPKDAQKRKRIALPQDGVGEIRKFLSHRRELYTGHYENEHKLAFDEAFCRLIYCSIEAWEKKALKNWGNTEKFVQGEIKEQKKQAYRGVLRLSDDELLAFLHEIQRDLGDSDKVYLNRLFYDLYTNQAAVPLFSYIKIKSGQWVREDHLLVSSEGGHGSNQVALNNDKNGEKDKTKQMLLRWEYDFEEVYKFEKELWNNLKEDKIDSKKIEDMWKEKIEKWWIPEDTEKPKAKLLKDKKFWEEIMQYPPFFITLPRYQGHPGEDPNSYNSDTERRDGEPWIIFYDNKGNPYSKAVNVGEAEAAGDGNHYFTPRKRHRLIVSVHGSMRDLKADILHKKLQETIAIEVPDK